MVSSSENKFTVFITKRSRSFASGKNHKLHHGKSTTIEYFDDEVSAITCFAKNYDQLRREKYYVVGINYENVKHMVLDQPVSQSDGAIVKFIEYILDTYMPIGIYNLNQINDARSILNKPSVGTTQNSNSFYQMIHHAGWSDFEKGNRPPITKLKMEMLDILESVIKALEEGVKSSGINVLDHFCNEYLQIELKPISDSTEFTLCSALEGYGFVNLFKIEKNAWNLQFESAIGKDHFLFHATRAGNMIGILKDGLLPAPTYVNSINRWLGKGIYFFGSYEAAHKYAERNFCDIILVCRVALGNSVIISECRYNEDPNFKYPLPTNKHSITQLGKKYRTVFKLNNDLQANIAIAQTFIQCDSHSNYVDFDEFVVQNKNQVKIEYLVWVNHLVTNSYIITSVSSSTKTFSKMEQL